MWRFLGLMFAGGFLREFSRVSVVVIEQELKRKDAQGATPELKGSSRRFASGSPGYTTPSAWGGQSGTFSRSRID